MKFRSWSLNLASFLFLPFFIYVYFGINSLIPGIVLGILFTIFITEKRFRHSNLPQFNRTLFYLIFILYCISIPSMISETNFNIDRFYTSIILLLGLILAANKLTEKLIKLKSNSLLTFFWKLFYVLLAILFLEVIEQIFLERSKNVLLFPEPSHFALIFLPVILIIFRNTSKSKKKLFILISIIIGAILIKSLTLLLGLLLINIIINPRKSIIIMVIVFSLSNLIVISNNFFDLDFLIQRINLSNTNNISVLVYLSGWENAINTLSTFNLSGIGFQQLGYIPLEGQYRSKLQELGFGNLNIYDGGTTASKIITELGAFGLILIALYLIYFRKITKKFKQKLSEFQIIFYSFYLMYFMELFVRGIGYFSPNTILFLCSLIFILLEKQFNNENITGT